MAFNLNIPTSFKDIRNYVFPTPDANQGLTKYAGNITDEDQKKNLSHYITPVQLQRLRTDIQMYREAVKEAEMAYYPQRIKMQRMFVDTALNGHVKACMDRRKRLTTLRDFMVCKDGTDVENQELTKLFKRPWFISALEYIIDSKAYGYSLVSFGDIINNEFPELSLIRRWNVSPERKNVTAYVYSLSGLPFLEEPYSDWHIWIPTTNPNGTADCGYGFFYEVAPYEIMLRNLLGFNGDFVELFSQPYRVGKTNKSNEKERADMEATLQNMGSSGWAVIDPQDEIEFIETRLGGTGYEGYNDLEDRCEKKVSKIILGHADALDSTPGKLGSEKGGDESPVAQALSEIQTEDGRLCEYIVNDQILPKMRNLGFNIPEGFIFKFKNDDEVEEFRRREDASNLETANIAYLMKQASLQMSAEYFQDRTGIPCETIQPPPVPTPNPQDQKTMERIQNKLAKLYAKRK